MTNTPTDNLNKTVLHNWHVANGAKMVEFGGWHMPVQYATGIIREHLHTRRHAGLFDVSHMGRFRASGAGAEEFLLKVLTNNAAALKPDEAQYTIIANDNGGAIDDAYLYRLTADDFLLVVNAANRDKDWSWLQARLAKHALRLTDVSEEIAMLSLQGPASATILEQIIAHESLPENKRNRMTKLTIDGQSLIVARTGYTGESVCFELFPQRQNALGLWEQLVELGAQVVGLGARDSLRLEASLPLYGHELGADMLNQEIPVFANSLATFAVRTSSEHDYIGRQSLELQREELLLIKRGECDIPLEQRRLKSLVQPIAVYGSHRPLRAGYQIYYQDKLVGYVTSGTTVAYSRFQGAELTATPSEEHDLRPIGLALIQSTLRYRPDQPIVLDVVSDRGQSFKAELVERNLWPAAPFARAYGGFEAPRPVPTVNHAEVSQHARQLATDSKLNTQWRRTVCINLIPSEQPISAFVETLCIADPAGRYNEHNRVKALGPNAPDVRYYKGTSFIMDKEEELKAALRSFFDCSHVEPRVVSGQMANDTVYDAFKQFKNRFRRGHAPHPLRRVLVHDLNKGGHLSAQVTGALKNYVAVDPRTERPAVEHFPFMNADPYCIDVAETKRLIVETQPELLVFGRSVIIHTEPVNEIADFIHAEFGRDNPQRPLIMYDAAHVLGLLGDSFQNPLAEGADIVTGSTHKTFFGPQRGVIVANIEVGSAFEDLWPFIESRSFPGHVSNHHLGTLLGMLGACYEMLEFKDTYPRKVIDNAKVFAKALKQEGLVIEGDPAYGYTQTHQVLLRGARAKGEYLANLLENNHIITNPQAYYNDPSFAAASGVRMGTQEMTRYGMQAEDFETLAGLLAEIIRDGARRPKGHWQQAVAEFRSRFVTMGYCF